MQKLPKNHPSEQFRPILGRAGQNDPELGTQSQKCPGSVPEVSQKCPGSVPEVSRKCPGSVPGVSRGGHRRPKMSKKLKIPILGLRRPVSGELGPFRVQLGPFRASSDRFGRALTFSGELGPFRAVFAPNLKKLRSEVKKEAPQRPQRGWAAVGAAASWSAVPATAAPHRFRPQPIRRAMLPYH